MQSITKDNAAPRTTTSEEQAASKVQHENINLSSEKPFQHPKAGDQPCLSFLYAITDGKVLRASHPAKKSGSPPCICAMHEADRVFIKNGTRQARVIAKDVLEYLIKFDADISPEDTQQLCVCVNILDRVISS